MQLDDLFGAPVLPARFDPAEKALAPKSRINTSEDDANSLRMFLESVARGCPLSSFLSESTVILWLADADGNMIFSVEELFHRDDVTRRVPNNLELQYAEQWQKLGHPSLVGAMPARIAGEMFFDPEEAGGTWVLSNKSGRYGLQ